MTMTCFKLAIPALFCAVIAPANAAAPQPSCFANVEAYMVATYGAAFRDDDQLVVSEKIYGKTRFTLVRDLTSGTNVAHVLLRPAPNRQVCVVLRTPPVAQLDVIAVDAAGVPEAFRTSEQASGENATTEIIFRRTQKNDYAPAVCNNVTWRNNRWAKKPIACPTS